MRTNRAPSVPAGSVFTFVLNGDLAAATDLTNHRPVTLAGTPVRVVANLKTAPVGAAVQFQLNRVRAGVSTAMLSTPLTVAAGATTGESTAWVAGMSLAVDDYLTIDCVSVGSSVPGADAAVVMRTS